MSSNNPPNPRNQPATSHTKPSLPSHNPRHIVVLGAGIIGLQSGLALLAAGYTVTIVARHFPGDEDPKLYTSPWAGAQWRTHASSEDVEQSGWDLETYRQWMEDIEAGKGEESGLAIQRSHLYWPYPAPTTAADTWWSSHVASFASLPASSLPADAGITSGVSFTTAMVNVPKHLSFLLSAVQSEGGRIIRASLPTEDGFAGTLAFAAKLVAKADGERPSIHAFINATGLGARTLVPDKGMYPTRGQTILVRGEASKVSTFEGIGLIRYVLPRKGSGTTILGGTKQAGSWDTGPDERTTRDILEGCKVLAPELLGVDGDFEVLRVQVGLRPSREGGARVQKEVIGAEWRVVHAYGHSGAGYQNSVGVARKVVGLIREFEGIERPHVPVAKL